eukprot:gene4764-34515_t
MSDAQKEDVVVGDANKTKETEASPSAVPTESRNILVPVDPSMDPKICDSIKAAIADMYMKGDVVHLLHCIGQRIIRQEEKARKYIEENFVTWLKELKVPFVIEIGQASTETDSIGRVICRRAERLGASCVVLAKHNRGAIKEFFLGSVTSYCLHHCKMPMLIIPSQD